MTNRCSLLLTLIILMLVNTAPAQFTAVLLQNDSYWGDGKAEFDFYDAHIMREGQARQCEVLHILMRDTIEGKQSLSQRTAVLPTRRVLIRPMARRFCMSVTATATALLSSRLSGRVETQFFTTSSRFASGPLTFQNQPVSSTFNSPPQQSAREAIKSCSNRRE